MNQEYSDPEIFSDFIVEAKEHLETIEPNLLLLEKQPQDLTLLDAIFRPMHSLKGASGFLGLPLINSLAHKAENILDELRKGKIQINADIMDLILAATDALRSMIENLETSGTEGEVDTQSIMTRITEVMDGTAVPAPTASSPASREQPQNESDSPSEPARESSSESPPEHPLPGQYPLNAVSAEHLDDFLEEAHEIVSNLNQALLELERTPSSQDGLINDIFRYMHNLKGNSGLLGFTELNALSHEAESLLGLVRKGDISLERDLVDLLLAATDQIDGLVAQVDAQTMSVTPMDVDPIIAKLRAVRTGQNSQDSPEPESSPATPATSEGQDADADQGGQSPAKADQINGHDLEDFDIFRSTARQQVENMHLALSTLAGDSSHRDSIDGLYRSLVSLQNSANYMGFDDLNVYAERTAKLVDQARSTDMGFDMFLDILKQEQEIIADMVQAILDKHGGAADHQAKSQPGAQPEPKPDAKAATKSDATPPMQSEAKSPSTSTNTSESVSAPKPQSSPPPETRQSAPAPAANASKPGEPGTKAQAPSGPADTSSAAKTSGGQGSQASQASQAKPDPAAPPKPKTSTTIRVDHERLDHLMNLIGELIINRNRFAMLSKSLEDNSEEIEHIAQQLTESTYAMARISDDLQDTIMQVRMVAVSAVFSRFPRLVRDLSRKSGKDVELITEGEETELDKSIVEVIGDPLVHLIRNSMDHGLENNEERLAAGKPATGRVWLRAYHKGNSVAIEVEDDGRGIDPAKMRQVALKKGLMSQEEVDRLDDREAVELIFAPGFSSAEKITDISGRGVGMDVVRTNIKNLKGTVNVTSELGKGSKMTLVLPLTLAIIDALMVTVDGAIYAIPLDAVSETTKIETAMLTDVSGRKAVTLRDQVLGIVELTDLLGLSRNTAKRSILPVVVITDNDRRLGLVVDTLLERQEVVIKPLGTYLGDIQGISGATIMGDGSVVLILDPHEIYLMATSRSAKG
jgi:two-component system, chemotaxis family, sensor kinase CheA